MSTKKSEISLEKQEIKYGNKCDNKQKDKKIELRGTLYLCFDLVI